MSKVSYNNRGYIGQSKSIRAAQAEENGLLPLSRITRKKGIAERLAALGIEPAEWHHTGKYARETNYWRVATVRALAAMSEAEFAAAMALREARQANRPFGFFRGTETKFARIRRVFTGLFGAAAYTIATQDAVRFLIETKEGGKDVDAEFERLLLAGLRRFLDERKIK